MSRKTHRMTAWVRHHLLASIFVVAVLVVGGMAFGFVAVSQEMSRPLTPAEAAFAACKTTETKSRFSVTPTTAFKQPDVGRPHGVIVVPRCSLINIDLPKERDLTYYNRHVDVYILVSPKQLQSLDVALDERPRVNFPYGVSDDALNGLVTDDQRAMVETDLSHVSVSYYVTAAPLPTHRLAVTHGYEYNIAPLDLLTGVRYAHLPFTQEDVYDAGPPIVISGK